MTDREKAIVMAYTGFTMLAGDKLGIFYTYVQEKLGRSVMTHELAYQEVQDAIQEAAKEDFIAIAKKDNCWISVKDRLPDEPGWYMVYAPTYRGGSSTSRENHDGIMFAKWSGKNWSVERCYYNRPGCVEKWMPLPEPPKEGT